MKEKNNIFKQIDTMISVVALIVLICITFIGVVFRYVLGTPFSWLEEVQLALIIWIVFCGGRYAFETNSHVAIDMIYDMFPNKGKKSFADDYSSCSNGCISVCLLLFNRLYKNNVSIFNQYQYSFHPLRSLIYSNSGKLYFDDDSVLD